MTDLVKPVLVNEVALERSICLLAVYEPPAQCGFLRSLTLYKKFANLCSRLSILLAWHQMFQAKLFESKEIYPSPTPILLFLPLKNQDFKTLGTQSQEWSSSPGVPLRVPLLSTVNVVRFQ